MGLILGFSQWAVPVLIGLILITGFIKKIPLYEVFIQGALEGLKITFKLAPYLLAIFVAIGLFRASGALNLLLAVLGPVVKLFGIPPDLITLAILKPLSGSASLGITAELLKKYGPDSSVGIMASIIQGSCETTFYVFSLYLGSVNLKNGRHLLVNGLVSEWAAFLIAVFLGSLITR